MKKYLGFILIIFLFLFPCLIPVHADSEFDLPLSGTGGYIAADIQGIKAGTLCTVLGENGNDLIVKVDEKEFHVPNSCVLVNLPDLMPGIVYRNSNSQAALYMSSGYELEGITGEKLYQARFYNERLERTEYAMPVMYGMAKKIAAAQRAAMKDGYSLVIYETYRPFETQMKVRNALSDAMDLYPEVNAGINDGVWNSGWFIAQSLSNHQRGCAMDVSLGKVLKSERVLLNGYKYTKVHSYRLCDMPTEMHELSAAACTFLYGADSRSKTAWKNVPLSSSFTEDAKRLQKYYTDADLTPLSSEWWHFNDLDAQNTSVCMGRFFLEAPESMGWK